MYDKVKTRKALNLGIISEDFACTSIMKPKKRLVKRIGGFDSGLLHLGFSISSGLEAKHKK
jgi:hypothetical protein